MAKSDFQSPQQEFIDRELGKERDLSAAKSITELLAILRLRSETPSQPAIQQQTVPRPHPFLAVAASEIQNPFLPASVHHPRLDRFKNLFTDPIVELKQLKETAGIEDYHEKFEELSTRVNLSEASLVSIFLDGLWMDTRRNTQMFNPKMIRQCLLVGRLYERVHHKKSTIGQLVNTERIKDTAKSNEFMQVYDDLSRIKEDNETIRAEMMQKEEAKPSVWSAKEELLGIQEANVNILQVNLIHDMVMEEAPSIPAAEEVMGVGDTNYNSKVTRAEIVTREVTSQDEVVVGTAITSEIQPHQHKVSENPCFSVVTVENDSLLAKKADMEVEPEQGLKETDIQEDQMSHYKVGFVQISGIAVTERFGYDLKAADNMGFAMAEVLVHPNSYLKHKWRSKESSIPS